MKSRTRAMSITLDSKLEARLRERADAKGLSVEAYVERLVGTDQAAEEELRGLALDGLNSGEPIEVSPGYWEEKHRLLDSRLKMTRTQ
jgi:antitoxin ParD1/3/4